MPLEVCVASILTEAYEQQGEKVEEVGSYRCQSGGSNQGWPLKLMRRALDKINREQSEALDEVCKGKLVSRASRDSEFCIEITLKTVRQGGTFSTDLPTCTIYIRPSSTIRNTPARHVRSIVD